ncbi:hypothetical protein Hypma_013737 [Hypsizygus marmoreus]|uniref:Uncharacterized protein n=1 Tax=Hypsizygus marmoreus TaxID=39966 RepID=A0A369JKA2_HYPMA|nr:hypothetical protein Hypma_013743 [Hypsizygus marmoreus]RDB19438.1 hypothetical protein Hypma_013737 [Hypsizygus marmoreus]
MMEEEYRDTLKGGKVPVPPKKTTNKQRTKEPLKKKARYVEPEVFECQPTSSKVKVEDLVTDEQEEQMFKSTQATVDDTSSNVSKRSFWDRPVPKPQFEWHYDPRMPREWNEMVAAMRVQEGRASPSDIETYRDPFPDEVSEPAEVPYLAKDKPQRKKGKSPPFRLPIEDEITSKLAALWNRFEKPRVKLKPPEEKPPPKVWKGKEKAGNQDLTPEDYPRLHQQWHDEFEDMVNGTKNKLPLWREVNHEIHLIDEDKRYNYHMPRCPHSLREEFHHKINKYVEAKWWEPRSVSQAAPLLCIFKKDGTLRTALDARQRNDNTLKRTRRHSLL